jgi:hypothetical protein
LKIAIPSLIWDQFILKPAGQSDHLIIEKEGADEVVKTGRAGINA